MTISYFFIIFIFLFVLAIIYLLLPLFTFKQGEEQKPKNLPLPSLKPTQKSVSPSFNIDKKQSFISFIGSNNFGKKQGRFENYHIDLHMHPNDITQSHVSVNIDMQSIQTSNPVLTKHLKNNDFFDIYHFPQATFVSSHIRQINEQVFQVKGLLTIKNIAKMIEFDAQLHAHSIEIKTQINRQEFRIGKESIGPQYIHPYIDIHISLKRK